MYFGAKLFQRKLWKKVVCLALGGVDGSRLRREDAERLTISGKAELSDYKDHVMEIDHPAVDEPTPDVVAVTQKPRKIGDRSKDEIWDLSLAEAMHLALVNNKILRVRERLPHGRIAGHGERAIGVPSTFDPAIQDSGVLFGGPRRRSGPVAVRPDVQRPGGVGFERGDSEQPLLAGGLTKGSVQNH